MMYVGIDVHKRECQVCMICEDGTLKEQRVATSRPALAKVLSGRACRVLVESSNESEWVSRHLESLGHEVIVADPNYAPMYSTRSKRVKTDKRDARALAEACKQGTYRPAHRLSDQQRHIRARLRVREQLVLMRSRLVSLAGAMLRADGHRVRSGSTERFPARVQELELSGRLRSDVAPMLGMILELNQRIGEVEELLQLASRGDTRIERLQTAPGVGPITAAAFVAALDGGDRFHSAHHVESYLGLVPREASSGEKQHRGRITKVGDRRMRALLVQAAFCLLRRKRGDADHLRDWAARIAARRGKRVAVVALARRLAGILFAMLRDGTDYYPRAQSQLAA